MWNRKTDKAEVIKADPRPFPVSANYVDASYYLEPITPLQVGGIDDKGRPTGVTASELAQWGLTLAKEGLERPGHAVPKPLND